MKRLLDYNKIIKDLEFNGFSLIKNFNKKTECKDTIKKLEFIFNSRKNKSEFVGNSHNQVLYNYFLEDYSLLKFVYNEKIFKLISMLLDEDHVLTSTSARNKRIIKNIDKIEKTSGIGWHTDTRYVFKNKVAVKPSLSYIVIYLLEDFSKKNGATCYVPFSHKKNYRPARDKLYDSVSFSGSQGDVIILDTALFHKAGESSQKSRWSIFSMYSSWFIKPYFQFNKMFKKHEVKEFNPKLKQLLHYDSVPPTDHNKTRATLKRVQKDNI